MERNESISYLLLSRLPQSENLAAYQKEVTSLLAENEKKLRRNKWTAVRVWIFVVVVFRAFPVDGRNPFQHGRRQLVPGSGWLLAAIWCHRDCKV